MRHTTLRKRTSGKRREPADPVSAYAKAVTEGQVVAGRLVRLACARHLRDVKVGWRRGLTWDVKAATHAIGFFRVVLRLVEGVEAEHATTKPFTLEPWQEFIVGSLFGWKVKDGSRRFRTGYIEVGKGNGKTPMAAGVGLLGLTADKEPAAEVYSAAVTRDQAGILFRDAERMVDASPALRRRVTENVGNLAHLPTGSFFRPVSSEARSLDGKRVHMALIDEVHEHPSAIVVDKMRAGTKGRRQAMIMEITNSGYDRHSVCYQHHRYSRDVLEGTLENDSWFAYVCALDWCARCLEAGRRDPECKQCDDWRNPLVWLKANPNLGVSITRRYLEEQVAEAVGMPGKQNIVRRLNFCEWTEQATRWLDPTTWDEVQEPVSEAELAGRECFGGLDLSSTTDLTALALLFPPLGDDDYWRVLMRYWVPKDTMRERIQRDKVPYDVWERDGFLRTTDGNVVDYDFIEEQVKADAARFQIRELAYDRFLALQAMTHLESEGIVVESVGQGFASMNAPCKEFEKLVRGRRIAHGRHPVLRWNLANVSIRTDPAGNIKPDRVASTEKIDGVVALLMALNRAQANIVTSDTGLFFA